MEYKHWEVAEYDKKASKILKSIKLNEQQQNELDRCIKEIKPSQKDVFEDMYKLYAGGISCYHMAQYYYIGARAIQKLFHNLEIQRSITETQSIAAKRRDYVEIRTKSKRTAKERFVKTQLFGSDVENLARVELSQHLKSLLGNKYEVIVGINSMVNVGELDIPIIIINGGNFYKFGIEVGNVFTHGCRKEKDRLKRLKLEEMGYYITELDTNATVLNDGYIKNYEQLKQNVKIIGKKIKEEILSRS